MQANEQADRTLQHQESSPRVGIGVPVYNGAAYLRAALDSLLGQTFSDFEIVISDNGSTDDTEQIAREFARLDSRVRYVRIPENRGSIWNFNHVATLTRGEYFKWAACDDICDATFLARCVEVLDRDPTVVCCHSRMRKIDESGRVLNLRDPTLSSVEGDSPHPNRRFLDVLKTDGYSVRSFGVIRTEAMRRCRPLLAVYGSEKVLMAELALIGRFHDIEDVLFYERHHSVDRPSTLQEQLEFIEPGKRALPLTPRLALLAGHLQAIRRSEQPLRVRALCYAAIGSYLLQLKKLGPVAKSVLQGTGTGGRDTAQEAGGGPEGADTGDRKDDGATQQQKGGPAAGTMTAEPGSEPERIA